MSNILKYPGSLHNHTEYSNLRLRDCINKIPELINRAGELGHTCIAITDHESIGGHVKVEQYAEKIKEKFPDLKIILGNEIYLVRNGLNKENYDSKKERFFHFILLAKDAIGHQQIREISSRAWNRSYMYRTMRRVPTYYQDIIDIVGKNPGHVIGSTACIGGFLAFKILNDEENGYSYAKRWCLRLKEIFGEGNFFLEMQPSFNKDQIKVNNTIISLSEETNIPYIITTDSHYLTKEDRPIHKAYLNSQNGDREVDAFYATTYLMSDEEIKKYFDYLGEEKLQIAYKNILRIQNSCEQYSLKKTLNIPKLKWKSIEHPWNVESWYEQIPMFKTFNESDYEGDKILIRQILEGLNKHKECNNEKYYKEINECLKMTWDSSLVNKSHWSAYFLNLQNIIDELWQAGTIVGAGRGSGVGFILLYLLDITQIDPLRETTATKRWRFLNPERVSVLDVDVDIEGIKRTQVLNHLRKVYGEDRVANVVTYKQEKSKAAILTSCRGLNIDIDTAQYISSLIPSDRGQPRTLSQCYYGDEENDLKPIRSFIEAMDNRPNLWKIASYIEGLICGYGTHAGGVIFVDEPFTNSTALMRAPNGVIQTQFELHDSEYCSLIKYDLLSVEALDKIHICMDLLIENNYIEEQDSLRNTYESVLGIYNIERTDKAMWEMVWNHKINSLFQMEQQSGIQGIALTKPSSVDDLATLNSVIRLMATEKGAEQPLNKFARFKQDINQWYDEMDSYGLTEEEEKLLEPIVKISYGICESQEKFMELVQIPECGGFNLSWADKLRKSIAKKNPKAFESLEEEYFSEIKKKNLSLNLCTYVWKVLVSTSKGYGFRKN